MYKGARLESLPQAISEREQASEYMDKARLRVRQFHRLMDDISVDGPFGTDVNTRTIDAFIEERGTIEPPYDESFRRFNTFIARSTRATNEFIADHRIDRMNSASGEFDISTCTHLFNFTPDEPVEVDQTDIGFNIKVCGFRDFARMYFGRQLEAVLEQRRKTLGEKKILTDEELYETGVNGFYTFFVEHHIGVSVTFSGDTTRTPTAVERTQLHELTHGYNRGILANLVKNAKNKTKSSFSELAMELPVHFGTHEQLIMNFADALHQEALVESIDESLAQIRKDIPVTSVKKIMKISKLKSVYDYHSELLDSAISQLSRIKIDPEQIALITSLLTSRMNSLRITYQNTIIALLEHLKLATDKSRMDAEELYSALALEATICDNPEDVLDRWKTFARMAQLER